jgi:hypothetical protein
LFAGIYDLEIELRVIVLIYRHFMALTQPGAGNAPSPAHEVVVCQSIFSTYGSCRFVYTNHRVPDGLSKLPTVRLKSEAMAVNRKSSKLLLNEKEDGCTWPLLPATHVYVLLRMPSSENLNWVDLVASDIRCRI